ncbi:hypothetical protein JB92DRAFT_2847084 [Gautieria morchelliformis]|nr:hypothetical protein JB92DRAFT_2847084 [Gautieria morchelliformis]
MLNLNLITKAKNIKRKLLNTYKRDKRFNASQNNFQLPEAALPDHNRAVTGVLPSANDLLLKETNLNATKDALELEKRLFDEEKSDWTTNTNAQKKKQALIQRGATIMFRMHRLEVQQERETMQALEHGLLQTAQQELDGINREQAAVISNLLAATAAQATSAAACLDAKARANAISDRLTEELDKVHCERLHIAELTEKVNVKSAELDALVSVARAERTEARQFLQRAQAHVSRFSSAAEAIGLVQGQIESHAIQAREGLYLVMEQERNDALDEARSEAQATFAALRNARTAFEKLREREKANLAEGHARVEHSRAVVEKEKELVKKEMARARLLSIKAERERATSVDAKEAALGELQAARAMRNESSRALHKLVALIAAEMALSKSTSDNLVKNVTSTVEDQKNDKVDGVMSRFISHISNRGPSLQAISGTTSSIDGIAGGRAGGLQKSEAETSSTSNLPDVPITKPMTLCQEPSVAIDTNSMIPIRKGNDLSASVGEKTKRLKISNRAYS